MAKSIQRVLMVHNYYQQPGGEDAVFASEKELLLQNGIDMFEYLDTNKRIGEMRVPQVAMNTLWSRASYQAISEIIKTRKPDLVHFHNTFPLISPSAYYACQSLHVPVVQTIHNYRLSCPAAIFYRDGNMCIDCLGKTFAISGVVHKCYRNSRAQTFVAASMLAYHWMRHTWQRQVDAYIALTEFSRDKLIEFGIPKQKIFIKPLFVSPVDSRLPSKRDFVLFVGRLSPEKGVKTLVDAFSELDSIPLRIAGDGPLQSYVKTHARPGLEWLGYQNRDSINSLMQNASFMVFPSEWYEVSPRTIMEAYSWGLPVIASRLGAMAEMIQDGVTGLLFEPGNSHDLALKTQWLWNNPQEVMHMSRNAHKAYEQKYTPEQNYEMLLNIYSTVTARQNGRLASDAR